VLVRGGVFKVSDFGFATKADISGRQKMTMCCGTPLYMSPQILEELPYSSKCDIWSWGMVLYECIFGVTPWPCRDLDSYLFAIKKFRQVRFPYGVDINAELKDFIQRCLTVDEDRRIGWKELF
jgi:calcium-dependent protein kinase